MKLGRDWRAEIGGIALPAPVAQFLTGMQWEYLLSLDSSGGSLNVLI